MLENIEIKQDINIMIVDDEPTNIRILVDILKNEGFNTRVARDGKTALSSLELSTPDLILLDINMPEMDGYEVCKRIKQDEQLKKIPVIFISSFHEGFDLENIFSIGAVDYLTKPFNRNEVIIRVKNHLSLIYLKEKVEKLTAQIQNGN